MKSSGFAHSSGPRDAERIHTLTRRYLASRNMGFLISMLVNSILILGGMGINVLLGFAIHAGSRPWTWAWSIADVAWVAAVIYFSVPRWGGVRIENWSKRYYRQEGAAELPKPTLRRPKWVAMVVAGLFGACILGCVALGMAGILPSSGKYMQPMAATFCVPFLVFLWWWQRPQKSAIALLWPALFALHAILVVAGAPIVFTGAYEGMNMFLPTIGYGALTGIVGHVYNRMALRRLQRAARKGL